MHWQLGEQDMARRAGVTPFTLDPSTAGHHRSSNRHAHSQSQGTIPRPYRAQPGPPAGAIPIPVAPTSQPHRHPYPSPGPGGHSPHQNPGMPPVAYGHGPPANASWPLSRHGSMGVPNAPLTHSPHMTPSGQTPGGGGYSSNIAMGTHYQPMANHGEPATSLPPLNQAMPSSGAANRLPSLSEALESSAPSSRSTPAHSSGVLTASPVHSNTASPAPLLPAHTPYAAAGGPNTPVNPMLPVQRADSVGAGAGKRRASPDLGRDATRRRHMEADPRRL